MDMIQQLLETIQTYIQTKLPDVPTLIIPEEATELSDIVTLWVYDKDLDLNTIFWAIGQICLNGYSTDEAMDLLGITRQTQEIQM